MLTADPDPDAALALDRVRLRVAAGAPAEQLDALPERCQRALRVAHRVGAPLLEAIDGAQAAQDDVARAQRAVTVASAQTRAVAVGLLAAPLLLVPGLGRLVGADLLGFYTSGLGVLVLVVAGSLLAVGAALIVVLVRRVGRPPTGRGRGGWLAGLVALFAGLLTWRLLLPALAPLAALLVHHLVDRRRTVPPLTGVDEAADLAATALAGGVSASESLRIAADELPAVAHRLRRLAFGLELGMSADDLRGGTDGPSHDREAATDDGPSPRLGVAGGATARPAGASRRSAAGRREGRPAPSRSSPRSPFRSRGERATSRPNDAITRMVVVLTTADEVGAPVAPTLRRLASDLRADDLARVLAAAERLPAQLTFPTALCLLPATVLLVGAPIVHAGLGAAGI